MALPEPTASSDAGASEAKRPQPEGFVERLALRIHNLIILTLIAVFFPWSLLFMLVVYGYDETRKFLIGIVEAAFGVAATLAVALTYLVIEFLILLGIVLVALAVFGLSVLL